MLYLIKILSGHILTICEYSDKSRECVKKSL